MVGVNSPYIRGRSISQLTGLHGEDRIIYFIAYAPEHWQWNSVKEERLIWEFYVTEKVWSRSLERIRQGKNTKLYAGKFPMVGLLGSKIAKDFTRDGKDE